MEKLEILRPVCIYSLCWETCYKLLCCLNGKPFGETVKFEVTFSVSKLENMGHDV